jgi:hypothetical protein
MLTAATGLLLEQVLPLMSVEKEILLVPILVMSMVMMDSGTKEGIGRHFLVEILLIMMFL